MGMAWALRGDNPNLGKMPTQAVEDLGPLADQPLTHLVVHRHRMVVDRPYLDEPHRGTGYRVADRSSHATLDNSQLELTAVW